MRHQYHCDKGIRQNDLPFFVPFTILKLDICLNINLYQIRIDLDLSFFLSNWKAEFAPQRKTKDFCDDWVLITFIGQVQESRIKPRYTVSIKEKMWETEH